MFFFLSTLFDIFLLHIQFNSLLDILAGVYIMLKYLLGSGVGGGDGKDQMAIK